MLPFTVTVVVPLVIARQSQVAPQFPNDALAWAAVTSGVALAAVGIALFVATLGLFITVGRGTLAPWDPPKHLVVRGPYRYVRNPMISGVLFVLFGEAFILRALPHFEWAVLFLMLNIVHIPLIEEPQLVERFGEAYREYTQHVGRFIPRLSPWHADR